MDVTVSMYEIRHRIGEQREGEGSGNVADGCINSVQIVSMRRRLIGPTRRWGLDSPNP